MPTIKALPKRTYGLEDVVRRISSRLFSAWPFLISEWDDFSYSESPSCMLHPNKFLLIRKYGFKEVLKIQRRLFSAQPSFLSKWNERSIYESLFGLKRLIKFLLMRTYGFEEDGVWQISRLLFSSWPSWYLLYSEPPCLPGFCSRGHRVLKQKLLEGFQDGC